MLIPSPFDADTILPIAEADRHARIIAGDTYSEADLQDHRNSAIAWTEGYTGHSLQERDFVWTTNQFTPIISLPIGPVTNAEISYYDGTGADLTVDAADFYLGNNKLVPALNSAWPYADGRPGGVRIILTAGYSDYASIPQGLITTVKLAMTAFFENRTDPDLTGAMRVADQFRAVL